MAVNLSPVFGVAGQVFDNNGNPLSGGKIYTYLAGTTTNAVTYTNSSGSTAHSNPIVLDGAGRVPTGEIWLTDGITYKFVVQDSTGNLIGSYDNLSGINSNFVNFTNEQEIQTATAGQTVFTLTTMQYQPGTNSLSVFVDGVNQYGPGAQYAFLETDSTTVTFISGLHVGAEVKFTTSAINASSYGDAFQISYTPPFTASVPTNVGDKLAQTVSVKDFGAVGDGVADDTAAIQAAIDYANSIFSEPSGYGQGGALVLIPAGAYKVSGLILKNGVSLCGEGRYMTTLFMTADGGTMFKGAAATSQSSTDNISWTEYSDFSFVPDPGITFSSPTTLWNMTGFSRCVWRSVSTVFKGNVTSWQMTGATLAGSGGPSNWYNSFYDVFTTGVATGGVGWELGDTSASYEQITTWNWYGGRTASQGATGTGMKLNAATGCNLYGHVFENTSDALIIGSAAGTRGCTNVGLYGCYFEGSANGYTIYANAQDTVLVGCFATGVTNTDNGILTSNINQGLMKFPVSNLANSYVLEQQNATVKPEVKGSTNPGWRLNNNAGNWLDIYNGAATSSATEYLVINDVANRKLVKSGSSSTQLYGSQLSLNNQNAVSLFTGAGTPEGAVTASVGSIFMRTDGGAGTSMYVKESGTGNTGWVAK